MDDVILQPIENAMAKVGLMEYQPITRSVIGGGIGYGIAFGFKPEFAFAADGTARPWKVTATPAQQHEATWFPYWAIIAAPAILFGVLI